MVLKTSFIRALQTSMEDRTHLKKLQAVWYISSKAMFLARDIAFLLFDLQKLYLYQKAYLNNIDPTLLFILMVKIIRSPLPSLKLGQN